MFIEYRTIFEVHDRFCLEALEGKQLYSSGILDHCAVGEQASGGLRVDQTLSKCQLPSDEFWKLVGDKMSQVVTM